MTLGEIFINLEIQHSVYTFDTACFYTDEEIELDRQLQALRKRLNDDQQLRKDIAAAELEQRKQQAKDRGEDFTPPPLPDEPDPRARLRKNKAPRRKLPKDYGENLQEMRDHLLTSDEVKKINGQIGIVKKALKDKIDSNMEIDRYVRQEAMVPSNIISIFDSALTRALKMSRTELNDSLIVVKVYYFGVAENIIKRGFYMNGEHYVFFSASAGQIRTKKFVAIKEDAYKNIEMTLTCGLTVDHINAHGGININKYLAYLALCNSATSQWVNFPVEHTIVIDDFETNVRGLVDHIDPMTFEITREEIDVPIPHTDGCGMILPSLSKRNFMLRAPWIKGLLAVFPFDEFIREADKNNPLINHALITDIYGVEHDVLKENIQIILTKSQFKLWKMYKSFSEYQQNFRKYKCIAGKCNEEPIRIDNAKFNYQMLQTLTDLTDEELESICEKTNMNLRNMASDRATMLQVFGATRQLGRRNFFQKCLAYYPELLQDPYCRETLRDLKNSKELEAVAGRLDIDGKYLFLVPDLYAACQHWFCHIEQPTGLLQNGEVAARIYKTREKLDVLRSPHLYKEHAVRRNVYADRPELQRWFRTDAIYTSSWDLISKILQFDVDGDRSLVCADKTIIAAAERNCSDVVPLYYEMAKASAVQVTPESKYDGMVAAWVGGNIGSISNQITRIWASEHPDIDAVKILVMLNNFVIDYAKTLFKPTVPPEWEQRLKEAVQGRVPRFFIYAKDKSPHQCEPMNQSVVNRLSDKIQSYKFDFKKKQLGTFDYRQLMKNKNQKIGDHEQNLIDAYNDYVRRIGSYNIGMADEKDRYVGVIKDLRKIMSQYGDDSYITDVLVLYFFGIKKSVHKAVLWDAYGEVIYKNLLSNNAGSTNMCRRCGARFVAMYPRQCLCDKCANDARKIPEEVPDAFCIECGRSFSPTSLRQTRCPVCQWIHDNPPVFAQDGEILEQCTICGSEFSIRSTGRGKRRKVCDRCRDESKRARQRAWVQYKRMKAC